MTRNQRTTGRRPRPGWGIVLVLLLAAGCSDTAVAPSQARLDTLWPNEDGRRWEFAATFRVWPRPSETGYLYPDPAFIPPAPSMDTIVKILDGGFDPPEPVTEVPADYTFRFDGDRITRSGVRAQNLEARLDAAPDAPAPIPFTPVLLHGGAFAKTDRWIGTYGDLDTLAAWKFLDRSLRPGRTFNFQLLQAISDEAFLHARIFPRQRAWTPAGLVTNAVEVVYLIDHGRGFQVREDGAYGYFRYVTFGNVIYVPEVGPVYSYERRYAAVGPDLGPGVADVTSVLVHVEAGPGEPPPPAGSPAR
jgi:hypothetical protein